jgi:hypothetical protein
MLDHDPDPVSVLLSAIAATLANGIPHHAGMQAMLAEAAEVIGALQVERDVAGRAGPVAGGGRAVAIGNLGVPSERK